MCEQCDDPTEELLGRRAWMQRATILGAAAAATTTASGLILPDSADAAGGRRKVRAPRVFTRHEWGADERLRSQHVYGWAPVRKLIVHHTASPNNPKHLKATVRFGYRYFVKTRGFTDYGYNFLIAPNGYVFEGRYSRKYAPGEIHTGEDGAGNGVVGGHAKYRNACSMGIALIGNYNVKKPSKKQIDSLVHVLAWKAQRHRIDPLRADPYISRRGEKVSFFNIVGHRGVGHTQCPGNYVAELMPQIRQRVAERVGRFPTRTTDARKLAWMPHGD